MNPWPFILGAYAATAAATLALVALSWLAMRRAEKAAERLERNR
jgi:hypothetical protein